MKFTCTQENFKYGLSLVSPISSRNVSLPILNNILIQAEDSIIKFVATNLEIAVSCVVRGKIDEVGTYTVPAKLLSDYVQLLPKDNIIVSLNGDNKGTTPVSLHVQCKNYKTKIKGFPSTDYPLIPKIDKNISYSCGVNELRQAMSQVIFSVSTNESRPEICGVLMIFSGESLTLAATDSYRLAERTISLGKNSQGKSDNDHRVIVPAKTLQELLRILGNLKATTEIESIDDMQICFSENQIVFVVGNIELTSRIIEGHYPDYKQIIPRDSQTTLEVGAQELIQATKTASLFARSGIFDIILEFFQDKQELIISSGNTQLGENICKISCKITGKNNKMVLNYHYLLDGLQSIDSESVSFQIIDDTSPCVVRPIADKQSHLYIIMPIKQ